MHASTWTKFRGQQQVLVGILLRKPVHIGKGVTTTTHSQDSSSSEGRILCREHSQGPAPSKHEVLCHVTTDLGILPPPRPAAVPAGQRSHRRALPDWQHSLGLLDIFPGFCPQRPLLIHLSASSSSTGLQETTCGLQSYPAGFFLKAPFKWHVPTSSTACNLLLREEIRASPIRHVPSRPPDRPHRDTPAAASSGSRTQPPRGFVETIK